MKDIAYETATLSAPLAMQTLDARGLFSGYASVFNTVDDHGDCISPGAFQASLRKYRALQQWPKMLWQHNTQDPIGLWHHIEEDQTGLHVQGQLLLSIQRGREAYALIRSSAVDSLSIGFRVIEASRRSGTDVRDIGKIDLLEVSIVTFAANCAAKITDVKGEDRDDLLKSLCQLDLILKHPQ